MPILYIITGPAGVGKSTISKAIAKTSKKSVLIEGDDIYHQVIGGYIQAWKEGNHLQTFWKICLNTIEVYLQDGFDVIFNYIVTPESLELLRKRFEIYKIKFVILITDENTLLSRDKKRPENHQMKERCIVLLNNFKNKFYDNNNFLDTTNLSIEETIDAIQTNNKFILKKNTDNLNTSIEFLDKFITVKIDRSIGSKHPKYGFIYPINYGYVPNTVSGDGEELDAYILGVYEILEIFTGKCIAIIHRTNDNDDKLIIAPENKEFSNSEIQALTYFQEQYFQSTIIRSDNYINWNKNIPELSITNLEESLKFYKTIGFKVKYERSENKFVFLELGEIQFMLQELSDNEKWDVAPLSYPFGNGINFQLQVNNLDEIYNSLINNNYKIKFDIKENWYRKDNILLGNKEFLVQDPDGYLLRFSEDLGEKEIT